MERLGHGAFFGRREVERAVAGFALAIKSADPDRGVERHTHEDAHFILLLDGHYVSAARGAEVLRAEPALIFNPPGTTHRDTFPDRQGRFLGISLSAARFAEVAQVGATLARPERIWEPAALALAHRVARAAVTSSRLAIEGACVDLAASFVRGLRDERRPSRWLALAREVLHDRAHDALGIAEVAAAAGVHPVHLARAFRRFYGCAPAAYVRTVRVERAARMLRSSTASIADVAATCGFVDQSHLTRAFAAAIGTTPAAYRRRHA